MSLPTAHFPVVLTRGERPGCEVFSWDLQNLLPTIPIPLLPPDPDLMLNLRAVFNLAYERGQYPLAIDYRQPLALPLDEPTLKWANAIGSQFMDTR